MREAKFWRFAALSGIFCGVRMALVHMTATFPKFFLRAMGPQAPFELIVALNPLLIVFCVPIVTSLSQHFQVRTTNLLLVGSILSGLSPPPLAVQSSYAGAICYVALLSIGEAMWSPELFER